MASYEDQLLNIIDTGSYWKAPNLGSLEHALEALEKALGDMSQGNPEAWSGQAAQSAAETFDDLRVRYGRMKRALQDMGEAIEVANQARDRAYNAFHDLPSASVPSEVHDAVAIAKQAGKVNVVVAGVSLVADKAVSIVEGWLGDNREDEARQVLENLSAELQPARATLTASAIALESARPVTSRDDKKHGKDGNDNGGGPGPTPPRGRDPRPPGDWDDDRVVVDRWPDYPNPGPPPDYPDEGWVPTPDVPRDRVGPPEVISDPWPPTPPRSTDPVDPNHPPRWDRPGPGTPPYSGPGYRPDVDSGSGGTIGGAGIAGGTFASGAAAGAATLRWASQQRAAAAAARGAGGFGGVGGILGASGARAAGAGTSGLIAPRGLAAGAGGAGATGLSGGAGAGGSSAGGASGGVMAGGAPGGGASGGRKGKKSGLGGHIAPKFEDDDDFTPQSESARAGGREPKE